MRKYCLVLFFIFYSILVINAQINPKISKKHFITENKEQTSKNIHNLSKANKYYKKGIYDEAFKLYEQLYFQNSSVEVLNYRLGMAALEEYYSNKALKYLLQSSELVSKDYYLYLGVAYQQNHKYEDAYRAFDLYNESLSKSEKRRFSQNFAQLRDECRFGIKTVVDSLPYFVINLGPSVNSYYDEYAPVTLRRNDVLYFTTRQPQNESNKKTNRKNQKENIKRTNINNDVATNSVFVAELNKKGNVSIAGKNSPKEELFYYRGEKRNGQIYSVRIGDGRVRKRKMKGAVNKKTVQVSSFSVSSLGDAGFITDKNKYKNGYDLFLSDAVNLNIVSGAVAAKEFVNTKFDERSVSFSPDGKVMYFSSNGHEGLGGYDIYKCEKREDGSWSEPINLGYPINTSADELFYFVTNDTDVSYVASNRDGGYGGLDIYKIVKDNRIPFDIWGDVLDIENGKPVFSKVSIIDRETNKLLASSMSDSISGEYIVGLEDVGDYLIQVEADGYLIGTDEIEMPTERHSQVRKDFELTRLATPFTFYGNIANEANNEPIVAEVLIKTLETDSIIGRSLSRGEDGEYSLTAGDKYNVIMSVSATNFFTQTDTFMLRDFDDDKFKADIKLVRSKIDYIVTGIVQDVDDKTPISASLSFYEPGAEDPFNKIITDSISGNYVAIFDYEGPFILQINAEGYFFVNLPVVFSEDSTMIYRNVELQKMSTGTKIVVENILFDTGKATLLSQSFVELNKLANLLLENVYIKIEVSGHTDNTGSAAVNKRLSRSRAESVRNYLIERGVDSKRLKYEGYGFDRPIESNDTPQGRAANRRVEIEVIE